MTAIEQAIADTIQAFGFGAVAGLGLVVLVVLTSRGRG